MQEALPYKRWESLPPIPMAGRPSDSNDEDRDRDRDSDNSNNNTVSTMESLVKENPVIVFGKQGCCMCHVVRKLLLGLGVNPPVFQIDDDSHVNESFLLNLFNNNKNNNVGENNKNCNNNNNNNNVCQFPVVFVGGELFGGLEKVMATHLSGELVPILKQAGALWL